MQVCKVPEFFQFFNELDPLIEKMRPWGLSALKAMNEIEMFCIIRK